MLVEDRDMAFIFLDVNDVPEGCIQADFRLADDVMFEDVTDEDNFLWLMDDNNETTVLTVVRRDSFDFENDPMIERYPIPTPVICLNKAEYDRICNE